MADKTMPRPARRRTEDGQTKQLGRWLFDNQTAISFNLIGSAFLAHKLVPQAQPYTSKLLTLSYYNPNTGKYSLGHDDLYFVAFCIVLFTGLRAGSMQYILAPLARRCGISQQKAANRFTEQGWMLMYYSVFWPLGMYIYCNSSYFLNMQELWTEWPQRDITGLVKAYILAQGAYWTQQILAVNMEVRRKDYLEIMAHHFLTTTLIAASYAYHYTRVGNLILVTMDVIELIFPLAKCLKSLGLTTLCDIVFGVFAVTWILTRHVLYLTICWSAYFDAPKQMAKACYNGPAHDLQGPFPVPDGWSHLLEPLRNPEGTICFDGNVWLIFISYLFLLQVIMSVWTTFLVKVIVGVLRGGSAEDVRSDDEAEEELEAELEDEELQPFEEEVGVEAIDLKAWERRAGLNRAGNSTGNATGIRLPGHSEQKEFLNRIGCETKIK